MATTSRFRVSQALPGVAAVQVQGRLDVDAARLVQECARGLMSRPLVRWIIFDMARVDFLDSTGLATLVSLHTQMQRRGGGVALLRLSAEVLRILVTAGEERRFAIFKSEADALQADVGR